MLLNYLTKTKFRSFELNIDHYGRFANQATPLPGTQVKLEREYAAQKEEAKRQQDNTVVNRAKRVHEVVRMKTESALLNTRIHFETVVGQHIDAAEEVLKEKDRLVSIH